MVNFLSKIVYLLGAQAVVFNVGSRSSQGYMYHIHQSAIILKPLTGELNNTDTDLVVKG